MQSVLQLLYGIYTVITKEIDCDVRQWDVDTGGNITGVCMASIILSRKLLSYRRNIYTTIFKFNLHQK